MLHLFTRPVTALTCVAFIFSVAFAQDAATKLESGKSESTQIETTEKTDAAKQRRKRNAERKQEAKKRAESLRKLADRLEIRRGATIADIGAGEGRDSWVFADIVGKDGSVFAVEITEESVVNLREEVAKRELPQVRPLLGQSETPNLPENSVDMAFMHYVYHHLAKPRKMLESLWRSLKPGGYYVVVDRHKGTLVDWVPRERREKKHFWLAETTFIREAREAGFEFVDFGEREWFAKNDTFVMIMQRPTEIEPFGRDPDPMPPINLAMREALLDVDLPALSEQTDSKIAFVALGEGRELIRPIAEKHAREAIDVVLEEWATQKDERPPSPVDVQLTSVLTEKGEPGLEGQSLAAVYFFDTYHLLFHGDVLLPALRERLVDGGRVFILDRKSDRVLPHREASHRRMIAPNTVEEEMSQYGFELESSSTPSSPRFLQVYVFARGRDDHQR